MLRWLVVAICSVAAGCVQTATVTCGAIVCSSASVCSPSGDRCVLPTQIDACQGKVDFDACNYPSVTQGVCNAQVCLPAGCGNGVIEPAAGEICDDTNRVSFDGCSADCASDESCGNGVVDAVFGELCDCGMAGMTVTGCGRENSNAPGATCRTGCTPARCGDSIVDPHEICDDGNTIPGDGCRADCAGRWTRMDSGTYAQLFAVYGTGPDNVYAVGQQTILHYDGVKWTRMALPVASATYNDVWAIDNVVFVVGEDGAGRIDRWDGAAWSSVSDPNPVYSISGRTANDVWAVGTGARHWNGSTWSTPVTTCSSQTPMRTVWLDPGSAKGYMGLNNTINNVCALSGASWTIVADADARGSRVWGSSAADVFSVLPAVAHTIDGTNWTAMPEALTIIGAFGLTGIGGSTNDVIVVGPDGRAIRYDGMTWATSPTPTNSSLEDVWGYAPGRAFIVGAQGTILY